MLAHQQRSPSVSAFWVRAAAAAPLGHGVGGGSGCCGGGGLGSVCVPPLLVCSECK